MSLYKQLPTAIADAISGEEPETLRGLLHDARDSLTPQDYETCLQYCISLTAPPAIRTVILRAADMTTLSPSLLHTLLHDEISPSTPVGRNLRGERPCDQELVDTLWPMIDVNSMSIRSAHKATHILLDTLFVYGVRLTGIDDVIDRFIDDPRLNLPAATLAHAFSIAVPDFIDRASLRGPRIAGIKNFDPNAELFEKSLLAVVTAQCLDVVSRKSDSISFDARCMPLIKAITQHPDFDPYLPLDELRATTSSHPTNKAFVQDVIGEVEKAARALGPPVIRRMDDVFKVRIAPERLVSPGGVSPKALTQGAMTGALSRFMPLGRWARNLSEVAQYEAALNRLPQEIKEKLGTQLGECMDALAERRTVLNRNAPAQNPGFLNRLTDRPGSGQAEGIV